MRIRLQELKTLIRAALRERTLMWEDAVAGEQEPNELYADYRPQDNYRPTDNYRPEDNYRPDVETYMGTTYPIGPEDNYRPSDASAYIGMTLPKTDDEIADEDADDAEGVDVNPEDETVTDASTTVDGEDDEDEDNGEKSSDEDDDDASDKEEYRVD